ncbi:hypothetical protein [Polaromonas sp. CF318]|uniref:hypothetical protein n=1 Tax=Polaromonas sp. CF318 TaxID=1144318 RepID=UPI0012FC39B9|nr:hypothetical protein [Polaromonas sp. CF318]
MAPAHRDTFFVRHPGRRRRSGFFFSFLLLCLEEARGTDQRYGYKSVAWIRIFFRDASVDEEKSVTKCFLNLHWFGRTPGVLWQEKKDPGRRHVKRTRKKRMREKM